MAVGRMYTYYGFVSFSVWFLRLRKHPPCSNAETHVLFLSVSSMASSLKGLNSCFLQSIYIYMRGSSKTYYESPYFSKFYFQYVTHYFGINFEGAASTKRIWSVWEWGMLFFNRCTHSFTALVMRYLWRL